MLVSAAQPEDFAWIVKQTGCALSKDVRAIKAVDAAGEIRGMVAYDMWTPNSCQAHMALGTPVAARSLLRRAFHYPFVFADRGILLGYCRASNTRARKLHDSLGFELLCVVPDGWTSGEDLCIVQMRRENCRWIRNE